MSETNTEIVPIPLQALAASLSNSIVVLPSAGAGDEFPLQIIGRDNKPYVAVGYVTSAQRRYVRTRLIELEFAWARVYRYTLQDTGVFNLLSQRRCAWNPTISYRERSIGRRRNGWPSMGSSGLWQTLEGWNVGVDVPEVVD